MSHSAMPYSFALLDPPQQDKARRLLDERGILTPGGAKPTDPKDPPKQTDDGVPLEP